METMAHQSPIGTFGKVSFSSEYTRLPKMREQVSSTTTCKSFELNCEVI